MDAKNTLIERIDDAAKAVSESESLKQRDVVHRDLALGWADLAATAGDVVYGVQLVLFYAGDFEGFGRRCVRGPAGKGFDARQGERRDVVGVFEPGGSSHDYCRDEHAWRAVEYG